ncbi:PQQ-binding-like beta-propeller repeat protein [Botrimarina hoheduenensis]|uniref:Outer membrane biogenesis protein BamB n=1 Tax=Botrimarina hoheduenensis TaxID=2528000 RepID=A0A5C5WBC9_9BACT|nr:PQQ-binding-like beta-propeller repeat protein [Botrimarina hoheduenensis]TWT47379.1 outer membrane biogenesis protein BamB [Botrimarina hoheduenensis]
MARCTAQLLLVGCLCLATDRLVADDWPQWMGPQRDNVWRESGVRDDLPAEGLTPKWSVPVDLGYAGPAVANGKVYVFEYTRSEGEITNNPGGADQLLGTERLRCLDQQSGEELWRYEYERPYSISYPSGPRCTPTVDGDRVYALGAEGDLTCLSTAEGTALWKVNFQERFDAKTPLWGHSAHPLVVGDTLYCLVGGPGSLVVALDKHTGEVQWKALDNDQQGYCPPSMIEHNGQPQLVVYYPKAVAGLDPATGDELWSVAIEPAYSMSIGAPTKVGDRLFATGHGGVSVFFQLPTESGGDAQVLWAGTPKTSIGAANMTPLADPAGKVIYGCDSRTSELIAIDLADDGARLWKTRKPTLGEDGVGKQGRVFHGTAFLVRQGDSDRYWIASETGDLILAQLTPEAYTELGRTPLVAPTGETFGRPVVWSAPAFAGGCVFARDDKQLVCLDLSADGG